MDKSNELVSENKLLQDKTTMLLEENKSLQKKISELLQENNKFKKQIQQLQDLFALEICEYFNESNNIRETMEHFCFENVNDCYQALVEYNGCSDPLQDADDYKDCYKEIFGREYEEDDNSDEDNDSE
jgi:predicted nuclease with TOPRIM domain